MEFGLACEGITDQVVIRSVLVGHFEDEELYEETTFLQPAFDETTRKQDGFGGWTLLLKYLREEKFRDDVYNFDYLIVQVDTDISNEAGLDVPHFDLEGKAKSPEQLVQDVVARLIVEINQGQAGFYERHTQKVIFALAVNSVECWLLAHYEKGKKALKIVNCIGSLEQTLHKKIEKTHDNYEKISAPLQIKANLNKARKNNHSLHLFLENIETIKRP